MDQYGAHHTTGHAPPAASSSSIPSSSARVTSSSPDSRLSHNISSFTDFTQFDSFDVYQSAAVLGNDHFDDDDDEGEHHTSANAGVSTIASTPSPYDPQPKLRARESTVSIGSLVYDENLGAYTKAGDTTAGPPAIPSTSPTIPTAASPAPVATPTSALVPSPSVSSLSSGPQTPYSSVSTPSSLRNTYQPSQQASEPAPYSTYDSSYGSASTPTSSTSYFSGIAGSPSSAKPTMGRRLSSILSSRRRASLLSNQPYTTIQEDEPYDESNESLGMVPLVQNAAPMSREPASKNKSYARIDEHEDEDDVGAGGVGVDLTSLSGPSNSHDIAFLEKMKEQEANGKLSGGLGVGFGPSTRLRESELVSGANASGNNTPISPTASTLARSLSRRWSTASPMSSPLSPSGGSGLPFGRRQSVRALAQSEANRRGEIVEVIVEEDDENDLSSNGKTRNIDGVLGNGHTSHVDLSVMSGLEGPDPLAGSHLSTAERRRSGFPRSETQTFYPQPNWRPFSMRWPYLTMMIFLSVGLGVAQEFIYRMSVKKALVEFHSPTDIDGALYFAIKFLPTIIAVTFGILWQVTDFEVKRLEAFYQLSKEGGAAADDSINVDYVTNIAFVRPFSALYFKHYAVAVSSILSLLAVSLVPTLSAASIVLTPDRDERLNTPQGPKTIIISAVWSRILTAVFFVIAALGMVLFWLLHRRRSGLLSDVRGIAGLASMAVVSHIMTDFKDTDLSSHEEIHKQLAERRYMLRNSSLAPDDDNPVSLAERERFKDFSSHISQNPHPLMLRARGCVPYICGIALFTIAIPIVLFTKANVITDKASWVLTAIAVLIKLGWGGLETSVRVMEPYYILWKRHAPAKTLTLDYTAMPFVLVAGQALWNRHWLVFFVGFATILTELLTVLVTSLATVEGHNFIGENLHGTQDGSGAESGEETALTFWLSLGLTILILLYMSIVATVVFVRRRRPFLPRQPNTIASVLAYIHQSKMLWDFVGTSKMNNKQMLAKLEATGHKYGLGWFEGRDGKSHCGVDQEELLSNYKPGYVYSRSNKPWEEDTGF